MSHHTVDDFNGNDGLLIQCIDSLLEMDAKGILVPHGIGGHARTLLKASKAALEQAAQAEQSVPVVGEWPHTMDAQVWARKWLEITTDKPEIATDEGAMIGWFANAIMAGYDTATLVSNPQGKPRLDVGLNGETTMSKKLRIEYSPLTGTIFAGTVLKDGRTWGANKQGVTIQALEAVAQYVARFGTPVEISDATGKELYRITVKKIT